MATTKTSRGKNEERANSYDKMRECIDILTARQAQHVGALAPRAPGRRDSMTRDGRGSFSSCAHQACKLYACSVSPDLM
jgi:hypothetical protein